MSKYRIVTPKGASFTVAGGGYAFEREALDPIGAEIIEAPATEAEFIAAARTADAIYAKSIPISKTIFTSTALRRSASFWSSLVLLLGRMSSICDLR